MGNKTKRWPRWLLRTIACFIPNKVARRSFRAKYLNKRTSLVFPRSPVRFKGKRTFLISSHEFSRTGAPLIIYHIAARLVKDYDVSCVFISVSDGVLKSDFAKLGPVYCLADYEPSHYFKNINAKAESFITELMRVYSFDAIILNSFESRPFYQAISKYSIKWINLIHECAESYKVDMIKQLKFIYNANIIYSCNMIEHGFEDVANFYPVKSHVLAQGLFNESLIKDNHQNNKKIIRNKLGINQKIFLVIGCGTVSVRKGCDTFLNLTSKMQREQEIHFIWIGDLYSDKKFASNLLQDLNQRGLKNIKFAGELNDPSPYYLAADCFVMLSRVDPFPTVVLEAMAAKLPVICFDRLIGSVEALDESTGFVVESQNLEAVKEKILKLKADPQLVKSMGEAARRKIERDYNFDNYVKYIYHLSQESELSAAQACARPEA